MPMYLLHIRLALMYKHQLGRVVLGKPGVLSTHLIVVLLDGEVPQGGLIVRA